LLALDEQYLARRGLNRSAVRGVVSISGVYNVDHMVTFHAREGRREASPDRYVRAGAPRFLMVYCQFDYAGLPRQAQRFAAALRKASVPVELLRIPHDNHLTEIAHLAREQGPLVDAVLRFVR
jgi:acetyl esterase/lipase